MINKTFNSDSTDGRALEVGRNGERPWLNIREFDLENTMFMLAPSDAPALCLAILEAAGVEPDREPLDCQVSLGTIVADLQDTIKHGEALAAEARERAELEAEALELLNVRRKFKGIEQADALDDMPKATRDIWLAVARRARELDKEATK